MMSFTSSVSDLEALLLKFKVSQDFTNALKVSNILDIVYSGEDAHGHLTSERAGFYSLHLALHLLEDDLQGARYLWKRAPEVLKSDKASELSRLWAVAKLLLSNDESGGLALLLQLLERADTGIDKTIMMALVARLRARQYTSILTSYDAITLPTAAAMLQLSAEECKNELLARGCISNNDEADTLRPGIMGKPAALNDGSLLQTLTQCVAELERQPLSIDMKKEIEQAQLQVVVEREEMMAMET